MMKNCGGNGSDKDVNGNIKTGTTIKSNGLRNQKYSADYLQNHSTLDLWKILYIDRSSSETMQLFSPFHFYVQNLVLVLDIW